MQVFTLDQLIAERTRSGRAYLEFLRVPALSSGLYVLPAGSTDPQRPHNQDELYYVIQGRARMKVGDEDTDVQTGSVIFVAAGVEHRFHQISEDLTVLVVFAPAETG